MKAKLVFKNHIKPKTLKKVRTIMNEAIQKIQNQENRKNLLCELYNLSDDVRKNILNYNLDKNSLKNRCIYARDFGVDCSIMRLLIDYDRYSEVDALLNHFGKDVTNLKILDYGSGAGDYGVTFSSLNSDVTFLDYPHMLRCPIARCDKLKLKYKTILVGEEIDFKNYDLVIFSEVLEHLKDPLAELKKCWDAKVKYVFTTSYPFVEIESGYFNKSGHTKSAADQIKECKTLLKTNYKHINLGRWHLFEL